MAFPAPTVCQANPQNVSTLQGRRGRPNPVRREADPALDIRLMALLDSAGVTPARLVLGVDAEGEPVVLPVEGSEPGSLWIGGPRGCGKSELLRSAVMSIAWESPAEAAWLVGIDRSGIELGMIEHLPHTRLPLVTEAVRARAMLRWLVDEALWRRSAASVDHRIYLAIDGLPQDEQWTAPGWRPTVAWLMRYGPGVGIHVLVTESVQGASAGRPDRHPLAQHGVRSAVSEGPAGAFRLVGNGEDRRLHAAWMPVRDLISCLHEIKLRAVGASSLQGHWLDGCIRCQG